MSSLATALMLLWALQESSPASTGPACARMDNGCKARMYVKKAAAAEPARRAIYLFTASRSYLALFAQTGDVRDLCAARKNFEQSLAVREQTASQRASFEESRAELEALEKQHDARCKPSSRRQRSASTAVARSTPAAAPAESAPGAPVPVGSSAPVPLEMLVASSVPGEQAVAEEELLAVPLPRSLSPRSPRTTALADKTTAPSRARIPGRSLAIGGGATLGVGVVLVGVAGYASAQVAAASRASYHLYDQTQGQGGLDVLAAENQIHRDFNRWMPVTIGTAIAGTTAVIAGAVMLRVGIRRLKQGPVRAALVPVPGGLAIHARF